MDRDNPNVMVRGERDIGKLGGREKGARTRKREKKRENLWQREDKEDRGKDGKCYSGWEAGMGGSERVERCTTTKYDDAAVGTRLTPSKNDRRCLPCFLRASQFPTSLLLVVSSLAVSPVARARYTTAPNSRRGYARLPRDIVALRRVYRVPGNWHWWCDWDGVTRDIYTGCLKKAVPNYKDM